MIDADDAAVEISPTSAVDEDDGESVVERVKELTDDTRTAIEAEIAFQKTRAGYVGGRVLGIVVLGLVALLCVFIALLSLAFGSILALSPLIGPVLATLAVVAVLLIAAIVAGLLARGRITGLKAAAFPAKPGAAS